MPYKSGRGGDQVTWLREALYGRDLHIATAFILHMLYLMMRAGLRKPRNSFTHAKSMANGE